MPLVSKDGALPHCAGAVHDDNRYFGKKWIGLGGPITWPPRSPDLTPFDFHLCDHMTFQVNQTPMDTVEELSA